MAKTPTDPIFRKIKEKADKARMAREGIAQAQRDFTTQRAKAKEEAKRKRES